MTAGAELGRSTAGPIPSPAVRASSSEPAPEEQEAGGEVAAHGFTRVNYVALALALLVLLAGIAATPPAPITPIASRTLGVLGFAVVLWGTGTLNPTLVSLTMMVLWPLTGVMPFEQAVRGFGGTVVWLLIGIMLISAAFTATGLDQRIAYRLLYVAHGRTRPTVLWTIITLLVLTFLVPTGVGRAGVMLPVAQGMMRAIGLKRGANVGKAIFLSGALVSLQSGGALMTGSIATLYAAGAFQELTGHTWTYTSWLLLAAPSVFLISLLVCPLLLWLFPPEIEVLEGGREYLREKMQALGHMRAREWKVAVLFAVMVGGWITAQWHGLSTEQVCLLTMLLMFLPPWSPLSFEEGIRRVSWSTIVLFGSSISLAAALERSRVTDLLVSQVQGVVPQGWPPVVVGLLTMVTVGALRLGFPNTIAMIATAMPISIVLASSVGINPVWLGMLAVHSSQVLLLPVQSPTSMTLFSAGYFNVTEMLRSGLLVAAMLIAVTLLFAHVYWPLLGVPPR